MRDVAEMFSKRFLIPALRFKSFWFIIVTRVILLQHIQTSVQSPHAGDSSTEPFRPTPAQCGAEYKLRLQRQYSGHGTEARIDTVRRCHRLYRDRKPLS